MYLVDSSVWINHFRKSDAGLIAALNNNMVAGHAHVIGDLALGSIKDRTMVLAMLRQLPAVTLAQDHEVHEMIEKRQFFSRGIGYTDCHILASALIDGNVKVWTADKRLRTIADELGVAAHPAN